jgi:hypothetical protein
MENRARSKHEVPARYARVSLGGFRTIVWQSLRRQWSLIFADRQLDAYQALGLELLW